ncbi:MAG: hypothetical protein EXR72_10835 [Myxococcales bacterium]|nr:hypothetical protein [Myxococcales bacterium]
MLVAVAGCGQAMQEPPPGKQIAAWPDDLWTVDDASTPTGLRLRVIPGDNLDIGPSGGAFRKIFDDLSLLDGFGTTAPLFVRFGAAIDPGTLPAPGDGSGRADASVLLVEFDGAKTRFLDASFTLVEEYVGSGNPEDRWSTLVVRPLRPLRPKLRHGLAVTTRLRAQGGGSVAAPPFMRSLLDGKATDPALRRLRGRIDDLLARLVAEGAIKSAGDLAAAMVFTTQHTVDDSAAIAAEIRKRAMKYTPLGACVSDGKKPYRACEGTMAAFDYRAAHRFVDEKDLTAHDAYTLPVTIYLPLAAPPGAGGYPTILYGHGLGGDRHQAGQLAELAAPKGFATIAIDAVKHGDHPDQPATPGKLTTVLDFFGFNLSGGDTLDAQRLRDNFRQSTYDKLQLVELLRPGIDADGDKKPDLALDRLMYLGVSLGGIMAAEFLAFAPDVKVAVPIVPGARVTEIIQFADQFKIVIDLYRNSASDGDVARFFPLLQTAIDRGDAGAYTPYIVRDRLPGFDQARPQLLMQMVLADDTVPNVCNSYFARGLGAPHVGDELLKIGGLPRMATLPTAGNIDPTHSAGVFEFDVVWEGAGPGTKRATHGNVAANPVAIEQTFHFVNSFLAKGVAEIIDPYRTLGLKK